jgi:hydrogenase-4 component E
MIPEIFDDLQKILIVAIILSIVIAVSRRNLIALINTYSFQSLALSLVILLIFFKDEKKVLLLIALITFVSKCLIIPYMLRKTQKSMKIFVDLEYNLFSPVTSVFISLIIFGMLFFLFLGIKELLDVKSLDYISIILGLSILIIGMLIIISRRKMITKIIGYLMMENGVLLLSIFIGDLPLLIEILILIDLIVLLAITSVLGFGIDSSVENFHEKLNPFRKWLKKVSEK